MHLQRGVTMRMGHVMAVVVSGAIWLVIGSFLLAKGIFLTASVMALSQQQDSFLSLFLRLFHQREKAGMMMVFAALILGMFKGRVVLSRSIFRFVKRILLIPSPLKIKDLFPLSYLILMGSMICLGMTLRFLPISQGLRGFIDLTIGSALINGAFLYFKQASLLKLEFARRKK